MHRDIARSLVFLALTWLLVSVVGPAPLPPRTGQTHQIPVPPLNVVHNTSDRRCPRHGRRPPSPAGSAPCSAPGRRDRGRALGRSAPCSAPDPSGRDLDRPPATRGTRRGRRGAGARRRGCRGGQAWRSSAGGRRRNVLVGLLNVQSLLPKVVSLQHDELRRYNHDLYVLTETWLRPTTPTRLVTFPGYTLHRADRPDGSGFGGVAILCGGGYSGSVIPQPESECATCQLESLWLRVRPATGAPFTLAAVYRPPRRTAAALQADFTELETQYQRVLLQYPGPVFILGDLNCNMLDFVTNRLSEMLQSLHLHQFVAQPTYSSGSLLDVVISNSSDAVRKVGVFKCAFSPHSFVRSLLSFTKCRVKPCRVQTRILKRIDHVSLLRDLYAVDWTGVYNLDSVAAMWSHMLALLTPVIDIHAPVKCILIRNPTAPPVTGATLDLMAQRRGVLRSEGKTPAFRDLDRRVRSAIRRDCRAGIAESLRAQGSSSLYRSIRPVLAGKRDGARSLPAATPDEINAHFVGVGPRVAASLAGLGPPPDIPCRLPRVGACGFRVAGTTLAGLREEMFSMKRSGACGSDGICIRILILCFDAIGPVLLHIINTCLTSCDFPETWKHSLVYPIFKSGDPSIISNYRPISLVPTMAKIVERVVQRQLFTYMSHNHLLSSSQHGFRPQHSTETALLSVTNRIFSNMDRGHVSLLCLLDLSKCFDVIPHSQLLTKLQLYNIDPSWFSAYLSGHTQSVSICTSSGSRVASKPLPNTMGVFQGSVLGPLLFTIFANDLSLHAPDAHVIQYADDTQILISDLKQNIPSLIQRMENTLASLSSWFHAHGLKLNTSKTELLLLGTKQNTRNLAPVSVRIGGEAVRESHTVRNLGVMFDRHLTWDAHVSDVVRRCTGLLIGLRHLRHFLPQPALLAVVQGLIISRLRYCVAVYGNGSAANDTRLLKVLNFATRVVTGLRKYDHISRARNDLQLLSPRQMFELRTLTTAYNVCASGEPAELASLFMTFSEARTCERVTRSDSRLRPPATRTATGQRSFGYRAVSLLNRMPVGAMELDSRSFKRAAKALVLS